MQSRPFRISTIPGRIRVFFAAAFLLGVASALSAGFSDLILSHHPVAYYRLEELPGASVAKDSSGQELDGNYVYDLDPDGDPDFPRLGEPGIDINSVFFKTYRDANNQFHAGDIVVPWNRAINPTNTDGIHGAPFSAECWLQPTTQPNDYKVAVASFGPYGTGAYANASGWNFYQSPGPASYWILNMKPVVFGQATALRISLGAWYHLAVTFDGAQAVFYVNGASQGAYAASGYLANPSAALHIGGGPTVGFGPFDGAIDEVAFYRYALSARQVEAHYQATVSLTAARSGQDVVLSWSFGNLQQADHVTGAYVQVPGATSPHTNAPAGSRKFYRVQVP